MRGTAYTRIYYRLYYTSDAGRVAAAILCEVLVYKEPLSPRRVARRLLPRRHPIPVPFRKTPPPVASVGAFTRFFSALLVAVTATATATATTETAVGRCVREGDADRFTRDTCVGSRAVRTSVPRAASRELYGTGRAFRATCPLPLYMTVPLGSAKRNGETDRSTLAILRLSIFLEFFPTFRDKRENSIANRSHYCQVYSSYPLYCDFLNILIVISAFRIFLFKSYQEILLNFLYFQKISPGKEKTSKSGRNFTKLATLTVEHRKIITSHNNIMETSL